MDLNSPDTWRWLWIAFTLIFAVGEMVTPATFFFLPFAVGAAVSAAVSFAGLNVDLSFLIFVIVSGVAFASLWKLGRKLEAADSEQENVGATRWVGAEAIVEADIRPNEFGTVRLEREEWRATSLTNTLIRKGSTVVVTKLAGVALIVVPVDEPEDLLELDPQKANPWH